MVRNERRLNQTQLASGARGITYRAHQLGNSTALLHWGFPTLLREDLRIALTNALVESALINARALAQFFARTRKDEVHYAEYLPAWDDALISITSKVTRGVSKLLAHTSAGHPDGDPHPGEWPIPELAVAFLGGLARFVEALTQHDEESGHWFGPPRPADMYTQLMEFDPLSRPARISDHNEVARLTRALHHHLKMT